jgi:pimeloyl-ACP methyl ester carboxylesterase
MNKFISFFTACFAALLATELLFTTFVNTVHAETFVQGRITGQTVWTKQGSPYLLDGDVYVGAGDSLSVEPGVVVQLNPSADPNVSLNIQSGAKLYINGSEENHVKISKISSVNLSGAEAHIKYADFKTTTSGAYILASTADIASSTFSAGNGTGIYSRGSNVNISTTRIENMGVAGIYVVPDIRSSSFNIHDSIINKNNTYAVRNQDLSAVHAERNWWGDSSGPSISGSNRVSGPVTYSSWLKEEPDLPKIKEESVAEECCSSILFLPGLEGTSMHNHGTSTVGKVMDNTLWPPNSNNDVRKLFLNEYGTSTDATIYSEKPLTTAYNIVDVYGKFIDFLDSLKRDGNINEWQSFGYDWRKPIDQVISGPEIKATTTEYLVKTVEEVASRSKTGKVSIVAHSNGGLVAKYLVKKLSEIGEENLIDTVISVAVPYLGTPQAIAGILHGDDQSIGEGLLTKQSVARQLGINMPSAYSLLPSDLYFSNIFTPSIAFASTSVNHLNNNIYPQNITSSTPQTVVHYRFIGRKTFAFYL